MQAIIEILLRNQTNTFVIQNGCKMVKLLLITTKAGVIRTAKTGEGATADIVKPGFKSEKQNAQQTDAAAAKTDEPHEQSELHVVPRRSRQTSLCNEVRRDINIA